MWWKPQLNFITLHYVYILSFGVLALIIIYPYGNLPAIDAYFFGVSAATESSLNTVDVKALKTYQQVFIYITPIVTNLGFVNIIVVVVRLHWFRQRFKGLAVENPRTARQDSDRQIQPASNILDPRDLEKGCAGETFHTKADSGDEKEKQPVIIPERPENEAPHIKFTSTRKRGDNGKHAFNIPGQSEYENSRPFTSLSVGKLTQRIPGAVIKLTEMDEDGGSIKPAPNITGSIRAGRRRKSDTRSLSKTTSLDCAVSSIFVLGSTRSRVSEDRSRASEPADLASLSREELGGVEYRALRVLLKIVTGYFFGLQLFGVICLVPWIHLANPKYKDYLASEGQDKTAIYSSQTMINNLGFTLAADSMISFRDATWPMLSMSFLALAGNTFYPCFLRLLIWTIYRLSPPASSLKESLRFLLDHPRRCYTLLFPSTATWALAAILVVLNFIDTLLIIVLDPDNPEVNTLPMGPRILAAIFQAVSARHTGTSTFNLANVNPAVQFSLVVMMYISIFPIAITIRMSSSYEEQPLGIYGRDESVDERGDGRQYLLTHMRNQLSFDLWYIFLGVFLICAAESKHIMDRNDYSFSIFSILFEVVSAYGNVGLSLGHSSNLTSLSGHFTTFSKLVICAVMVRGRHRGMPYALDRAITLPSDRLADEPPENEYDGRGYDNDDTDGEMNLRVRTEELGRTASFTHSKIQ